MAGDGLLYLLIALGIQGNHLALTKLSLTQDSQIHEFVQVFLYSGL